TRRWSPAAKPRVSLIDLNRSTSRKSTANGRPAPCPRWSSAPCRRSRNKRRLARPVRPSCSAACSSSSCSRFRSASASAAGPDEEEDVPVTAHRLSRVASPEQASAQCARARETDSVSFVTDSRSEGLDGGGSVTERGPMADAISIGEGVSVPAAALSFRATRSSGPGGQNVNKVASKVELRVDLAGIEGLPPEARQRRHALALPRLDAEGRLGVTSQRT